MAHPFQIIDNHYKSYSFTDLSLYELRKKKVHNQLLVDQVSGNLLNCQILGDNPIPSYLEGPGANFFVSYLKVFFIFINALSFQKIYSRADLRYRTTVM